MSTVFTPQKLFAELPRDSYESYSAFEQEFVRQFNHHLFDFPPQYRWRDALEWGLRRNVVRREGDRVIVIRTEL